MYCRNCGQQIDENITYCPNCGAPVSAENDLSNTVANTVCVNDAPSTGFAVLGFFIPLVGLILFLLCTSTQPLKAKSAGKGALIGVAVRAAIYMLIVVLNIIGMASMWQYLVDYI